MLMDWKTMPEGRAKYNAYLASREWAVLKEQVKSRSGGECEHCNYAPGTQTHHQTYERKYCELLSDLLHVCAPCHEFLSGKTNVNPAVVRPLLMFAGEIELWAVYLAGKITGTTWRNEIAPGWSRENKGLDGCSPETGDWRTVADAIPVDHRSLALTGPWWRPLSQFGGHSNVEDNQGKHASGETYDEKHGIVSGAMSAAAMNGILRAIEESDLVFAWIDTLECCGTLWELGYANGIGKQTAICFSNDSLAAELWIPFMMARNDLIVAPSAGEAWKIFLEKHTI